MNRVLKSQDIEELNFFTTPANQEKEIKWKKKISQNIIIGK